MCANRCAILANNLIDDEFETLVPENVATAQMAAAAAAQANQDQQDALFEQPASVTCKQICKHNMIKVNSDTWSIKVNNETWWIKVNKDMWSIEVNNAM